MSFMEPEITCKQQGWLVETLDGTWWVPSDVHDVPQHIKQDVTLVEGDVGFDELKEGLKDYCGSTRITGIEAVFGYFYRMSAPGYLDCTDWCFAKTIREAKDDLKENYLS
jgi:hypothetical protein